MIMRGRKEAEAARETYRKIGQTEGNDYLAETLKEFDAALAEIG